MTNEQKFNQKNVLFKTVNRPTKFCFTDRGTHIAKPEIHRAKEIRSSIVLYYDLVT